MRTYYSLIGTGVAVIIALALAITPQVASADSHFNTNLFGVAIKGYDPVAYFPDGAPGGKPVKGDKEFQVDWEGATWRFANASNLEMFKEDPEKYAPRYGGYCAYGVANNYLVSIDPDAWTVYEGRLYLNYSLKVREQWVEDIPGYIKKADTNWPGLKGN